MSHQSGSDACCLANERAAGKPPNRQTGKSALQIRAPGVLLWLKWFRYFVWGRGRSPSPLILSPRRGNHPWRVLLFDSGSGQSHRAFCCRDGTPCEGTRPTASFEGRYRTPNAQYPTPDTQQSNSTVRGKRETFSATKPKDRPKRIGRGAESVNGAGRRMI
jgi:hypothetical protein